MRTALAPAGAVLFATELIKNGAELEVFGHACAKATTRAELEKPAAEFASWMGKLSKEGVLALTAAAGAKVAPSVMPKVTAQAEQFFTSTIKGAREAMRQTSEQLGEPILATPDGLVIKTPTTQSKTPLDSINDPIEARRIPMGKRNASLAGKKHPITDVPYNDKAYPIFESKFDVKLPKNMRGVGVSDDKQFKYATERLKAHLEKNPLDKQRFTTEQLTDIEAGKPKIKDLTWHHHEDGVRLQAVDHQIHSKSGHDGGRKNSGGRP